MLIDIGTLWRGGAERQVVLLASGLASRGHQLLLVVQKDIRAYEAELVSGGVDVVELRRISRHDPRVLTDLIGVVRGFRPDVCLCVGFTATLWGRLAALVYSCPSVTAEHATETTVRRSVYLTNLALGRWTAASVACTMAQAPSLITAGVRRDCIVAVNNGVDTEAFHPDEQAGRDFRLRHGLPLDAFIVGIVANHRPEKRHDRFVRALDMLGRRGIPAWGCMVGGGTMNAATKSEIAARGIDDRLTVVGACNDMIAAYSALDVVVLVSDCETYPLCMLEAQACGRPVVAMDYSGVSETFEHRLTGLLVDNGDIEGFTDAVGRLCLDPELRRTMGGAAREWIIANRSAERMVEEYERLLQRVVDEARAGKARRRLTRL